MPDTALETAAPAGDQTPAVPPPAGSPAGAAPTPAPAPADTGTPPTAIADDAPPAAPVAGDWPENWRELKAGGDEKLLKRLQRYASPSAALDALFAAQDKIRSGAVKEALPENPTSEQLAAWRQDNGIPDTPEGYDLTLDNGIVIGEEDKPLVDEFLKAAHAQNMRPAEVKGMLSWYYGQQEQAMAEMAARDKEYAGQCAEALRAEYGKELQVHNRMALEVLEEAGDEFKDTLLVARGPDGKRLGDNPKFVRWLVNLARERNPYGTLVPGSGTNSLQAIAAEKAKLQGLMGDRQSEYWRGPMAEQHQARYRQILEAEERFASKNKAA